MDKLTIAGHKTFIRLEDDQGRLAAYVGSPLGLREANYRAKIFSVAERYNDLAIRLVRWGEGYQDKETLDKIIKEFKEVRQKVFVADLPQDPL